MSAFTLSADGRASLKTSPEQLKNRGWSASHVVMFSAIAEALAVPASWHVMPVATLVEVAVRLAPDCWILKM